LTATELYIYALTTLKPGELGLLRTHSGQGLDESAEGFDLFTGLWWPLRQSNERAPRREVAWLIAKLYAFRQIDHSPGDALTSQLRQCQPSEERARDRFQKRIDEILTLPLKHLEPDLRWALDLIASKGLKIDWAELTDDLSKWERESTRLKWANKFLESYQENSHAD
jgi:CRISPR type I-E-associated protein CasB/Cse2